MNNLIPIRLLRSGQIAEIGRIAGPPEQIRRLNELGMLPGTRFELVRGGSPCILRVAGTTLCFRDDELLSVWVAPRMIA